MCCNVSWNRSQQWNRVGAGSGCSGRASFKACDACGDVFNEILTRAETFGGRRFGWPRTKAGAVDLCFVSRGECGWGRKKGGEDVVAVVKGGGKRRVLDSCRDERWRGRWRWWKEASKLKGFGMRSGTGDAIIFGDGLV